MAAENAALEALLADMEATGERGRRGPGCAAVPLPPAVPRARAQTAPASAPSCMCAGKCPLLEATEAALDIYLASHVGN